MNDYRPENILVTGAAGFIGSNFVKHLLNKHKARRVVSYDKLTYAGDITNLGSVAKHPNHEFIQGDILDAKKIVEILKEKAIDTIVHFAAESHVDNSIEGPAVFFKTNVLGTQVLLDQAKKLWLDEQGRDKKTCRFHHVSTDEVYGSLKKEDVPFTENNQYKPNSPYAASKAGSDHIVKSYYKTYDLPITISNCSNNYGPNQHNEKLIPKVISHCLNDMEIPIYGDGSNIRDWIYVGDHCDAIDTIIRRGRVGETYNAGGNNEVDNLSLVKQVCSIMDELAPSEYSHSQRIVFSEDRKGHDWRYAIDNTKINTELQWQPGSDFSSSLRETVNFYLTRK